MRLDALFNDPRNWLFDKSKFPELRIKELLVSWFSGGTPTSSEATNWNGDILWASPKDFSDDIVITDTQDHITEAGRQAARLNFAEPGTVLLVVRSGILKHTLPVMVCSQEMTVNQDVKALILRPDISPLFFAEYLRVHQSRILPLITKHGTTVQSVNTNEFERLLIPLPPLDIQRALVAEMEAARESRRAKLNEADALLKSLDGWLLAQLGLEPPPTDDRKVFAVRLGNVQGRYDSQFHLPRFQKILETIKRTQHFPLGSLASFSHEVWNIAEATKRGDTTFRYIEISGVNRATGEARAEEVSITEAPSRARMLVEDGDIIISLTRPHHGSIAQIDASLHGCIASTGFAIVRYLDKTRITADYLWSMLRTQLCLQQMLQRSSGGNYPAITEDELAKILVPVPDLPTQALIAVEVHHRRAEVRRLRAEAEAEWQAAKECFEQQLLTGK